MYSVIILMITGWFSDVRRARCEVMVEDVLSAAYYRVTDVSSTGAMLPLSVCVSRGFPVPSSLSGVCTRVCMLSINAVSL